MVAVVAAVMLVAAAAAVAVAVVVAAAAVAARRCVIAAGHGQFTSRPPLTRSKRVSQPPLLLGDALLPAVQRRTVSVKLRPFLCHVLQATRHVCLGCFHRLRQPQLRLSRGCGTRLCRGRSC